VGTRADGSSFPAEVSMIAVDGPGPRFFTAFVRDLTDREAASSARRDLEFRVQQTERLESLGQLAGGVAHDFNNLLTVILNYATFIAESEANDAETREQAAEVVSSAERAARLTHQMLLFARREPVRRLPIDLATVIVDTSDLLQRAVGEQVQVVVRSEDGLPLVTGDRGQTEQLLMNLAVNARDAMPAGGTFTIDTSTDQRGGASFVVLSVADTGVGMSPETAARAFDPFFTTKPAGEGSGLGLATVYGIVADAGGTVDLTSRPGHGTTFTVWLPATDQAAVALDVAIAEPPAGGEGQVILVVEDQESVRKIVVAMLARNGYEVIQASDAAEALTLAGERRFDLLLTDIVMPGRSGTELADALTEQRSDHRVLFMSGYSGGIFGTQRELDASETIIHKPFHEADLLVAVRTALRAPPHRSAPSSIAIS
jgi:CheY-like chemotaxis protein